MLRLKTLFAAALVSMFTALSPIATAGSIASGAGWDNVQQKTSGGWAIVEDGGRHYVEFAGNFKARSAPDLKIYLSRNAAKGLGNRNGLNDTVFVAKLKSSKGAQRYALPKSVNPEDFTSLVIYCEAYSKFWAAADL